MSKSVKEVYDAGFRAGVEFASLGGDINEEHLTVTVHKRGRPKLSPMEKMRRQRERQATMLTKIGELPPMRPYPEA